MKRYLITGGTGLIGRALCESLIAEGDEVIVLSRNPAKVKSICGQQVRPISALTEIEPDTVIHVVINLAGEPIADQRWSDKKKHLIESSRVDFTKTLVDWLIHRNSKPECLISGSAVGWYGDGGDKKLTEQASYHEEYTHQLCDAWEKQALRAGQIGIRVCIVRTGLVLSTEGGVLEKMLLPFKLGLGGRLGTGQQYMPWIHITDMVNILKFLIDNEQFKGIFNGCSPKAATNSEFSQSLAQSLNRFAVLPAPAWLLKIALGEMSRLLLTGQNAVPQRLLDSGFEFSFTDLDATMSNLLHDH
jgi:uncharacterized protein (TIGR01777 family)